MRKTILEIYALAVCFFTVACFVISLGVGLYDLIEIVDPEFTLGGYEYERHQTNEAFAKQYKSRKEEVPPDDELTRLREESYRLALKNERRSGMQSLTQVVIIIIIDVMLFLFHWFLAKKARTASPIAPETDD
jgi:hypothetical protein